MKKSMIILVMGVLLSGCGTLLSGMQENRPIPEDILEFYRNNNFVCAFTTQSERMRMAACLDDGVLPAEMDSPRYHEIFLRMKRLIAQVHIKDSDMVLPHGAGKNLQKVVFRQELFEVQAFRRSNGGAGIDVFAYALEPEMALRYISEFEDNQGDFSKITTEAEILKEAGSRIEQRRETHNWNYINGRWMKTFNNYVFLKK